MSILIDCVRISGFRGLANIEVSLRPLTLLIGANNTGKTSIIKAIQLALGDYSRFLTEEDFFIDGEDKQSEKIIIDVRIIPVDSNKNKIANFSDIWAQEFGDKIQSDPLDRQQYLALRAVASPDPAKGGFAVERYHLTKWPEYSQWTEERVERKNRLTRFEAIRFISVEPQRDIHGELRDKFSFLGRVLSKIKYEESDIERLEEMISQINEEAVDKSDELKILKEHLEKLNHHFNGIGNTELSPFPKKIRDLSKRFSIHFGEKDKNTFSMEYHGMGTRSWASMLTVKAFSNLLYKSHENEEEPFFSITGAEEPEAHLHPNAQRTLYSQLSNSEGQVIISSHSPYLAAMADIEDLRGLYKDKHGNVKAQKIVQLDEKDKLSIKQHVLLTRGEIIFSKAVILFEGLTEEQLIPAMFEAYFGFSGFSVGVSFVGVSGKNYAPFVKLALSFGVPVCIISDADGNTPTEIKKQIDKLKQIQEFDLSASQLLLEFLTQGNDMETELLNVQKLKEEILQSLLCSKTVGRPYPKFVEAKRKEVENLSDEQIMKELKDEKASYSAFLAEIILHNPNNKTKEELIPQAVRNAFKKIREWLSL